MNMNFFKKVMTFFSLIWNAILWRRTVNEKKPKSAERADVDEISSEDIRIISDEVGFVEVPRDSVEFEGKSGDYQHASTSDVDISADKNLMSDGNENPPKPQILPDRGEQETASLPKPLDTEVDNIDEGIPEDSASCSNVSTEDNLTQSNVPPVGLSDEKEEEDMEKEGPIARGPEKAAEPNEETESLKSIVKTPQAEPNTVDEGCGEHIDAERINHSTDHMESPLDIKSAENENDENSSQISPMNSPLEYQLLLQADDNYEIKLLNSKGSSGFRMSVSSMELSDDEEDHEPANVTTDTSTTNYMVKSDSLINFLPKDCARLHEPETEGDSSMKWSTLNNGELEELMCTSKGIMRLNDYAAMKLDDDFALNEAIDCEATPLQTSHVSQSIRNSSPYVHEYIGCCSESEPKEECHNVGDDGQARLVSEDEDDLVAKHPFVDGFEEAASAVLKRLSNLDLVCEMPVDSEIDNGFFFSVAGNNEGPSVNERPQNDEVIGENDSVSIDNRYNVFHSYLPNLNFENEFVRPTPTFENTANSNYIVPRNGNSNDNGPSINVNVPVFQSGRKWHPIGCVDPIDEEPEQPKAYPFQENDSFFNNNQSDDAPNRLSGPEEDFHPFLDCSSFIFRIPEDIRKVEHFNPCVGAPPSRRFVYGKNVDGETVRFEGNENENNVLHFGRNDPIPEQCLPLPTSAPLIEGPELSEAYQGRKIPDSSFILQQQVFQSECGLWDVADDSSSLPTGQNYSSDAVEYDAACQRMSNVNEPGDMLISDNLQPTQFESLPANEVDNYGFVNPYRDVMFPLVNIPYCPPTPYLPFMSRDPTPPIIYPIGPINVQQLETPPEESLGNEEVYPIAPHQYWYGKDEGVLQEEEFAEENVDEVESNPYCKHVNNPERRRVGDQSEDENAYLKKGSHRFWVRYKDEKFYPLQGEEHDLPHVEVSNDEDSEEGPLPEQYLHLGENMSLHTVNSKADSYTGSLFCESLRSILSHNPENDNIIPSISCSSVRCLHPSITLQSCDNSLSNDSLPSIIVDENYQKNVDEDYLATEKFMNDVNTALNESVMEQMQDEDDCQNFLERGDGESTVVRFSTNEQIDENESLCSRVEVQLETSQCTDVELPYQEVMISEIVLEVVRSAIELTFDEIRRQEEMKNQQARELTNFDSASANQTDDDVIIVQHVMIESRSEVVSTKADAAPHRVDSVLLTGALGDTLTLTEFDSNPQERKSSANRLTSRTGKNDQLTDSFSRMEKPPFERKKRKRTKSSETSQLAQGGIGDGVSAEPLEPQPPEIVAEPGGPFAELEGDEPTNQITSHSGNAEEQDLNEVGQSSNNRKRRNRRRRRKN